MWYVADNHKINMCVTCATGFQDSSFNSVIIDKISNFMKLPQISHIHKNHNF